MTRDTSIQSYYDLECISKRQRLILNLIMHCPDRTDRELCKLIGKEDPNYLRPRRKELLDKNLIEESGKRICKVTGKVAYTWKCKPVNLF